MRHTVALVVYEMVGVANYLMKYNTVIPCPVDFQNDDVANSCQPVASDVQVRFACKTNNSESSVEDKVKENSA